MKKINGKYGLTVIKQFVYFFTFKCLSIMQADLHLYDFILNPSLIKFVQFSSFFISIKYCGAF